MTRTTRLGVGLATLMRESSAIRRQDLLHAAFDLGYRHFDVAPSYGLGLAEATLGSFLDSVSQDVTVATKIGITIRDRFGILRALAKPARRVIQRFPTLRGRATSLVGTAVHSRRQFTLQDCVRSFKQSLRALRTSSVDVLLLHDADIEDVENDSLLTWLQKQRAQGLARAIGIATSTVAARQIISSYPDVFDVVQVPSDVTSPASTVLEGVPGFRITHSALSQALARVRARRDAQPVWASELSSRLGTPIVSDREIAQMLIACALADNPNGLVLIGASQATHLRDLAFAVSAYTQTQIADVSSFLQDTLR